MPQTPHIERHFTGTETVRDIVIGMSDGLTVPFALAAGLSGAVDTTRIIVTAGLAEVAAGSIAMGLGGYRTILTCLALCAMRFALCCFPGDGEGDDEPGSLVCLALCDDRSPMLFDDILCDG